MSDFSQYTYPIARKNHICEYCYGPIPKGEKHVKHEGVFDGEWCNYRLHNECDEALTKDDWNIEFTPGEGEMPERVKLIAANLYLEKYNEKV